MRDRLGRAGWDVWIPLGLSILFVLAATLSLFEPRWIEDLFGASPDDGSGESEWWITAILGAVAVISLAVTRWRWRAVRAA